ncbi:L-dopachrome tautomerase-related protein, partial [Christiangramia marina]|uniref:L-dopachrome tautomerase-related protein n=1 Tax=Christiangramia marina TaxID=409436 RepID=UPI003AA96071
MKKAIVFLFSLALSLSLYAQNNLEIVSEFPEARPGNITVSEGGRVFVTMSALSSSKYMVMEIMEDGTSKPFGEKEWIQKPEKGSIKGINSTIGIQTDKSGNLWVLDMGNIKEGQAPKLVSFNLDSGRMNKVFTIPTTVLTDKPFLQDFVIDDKHQVAVIADMTDALNPPIAPAFVVIDLKTGYIKRILENHESFQPVDESVSVGNQKVIHKRKDGSTIEPRYPLNPISIDEENKFIYYGAMGNTKIYKISAEAVADLSSSPEKLNDEISFHANKPKSDGFKVGKNGNVYVTDVENSAIVRSNSSGMKTLAKDVEKLSWPDGVAIYGDTLYIVANQLHNLPLLNNGKDASNPPFLV